jgi:hypothetical protein
MLMCRSLLSTVLTPPTMAMSDVPSCRAQTARWVAISALEQAVSTGSLGPCTSRK